MLPETFKLDETMHLQLHFDSGHLLEIRGPATIEVDRQRFVLIEYGNKVTAFHEEKVTCYIFTEEVDAS